MAVKIIKNRTETLVSSLSSARNSFQAGNATHESFYETANKVSSQSQALASFVTKITPPKEYKLSYLHRVLATNLLSQEAAVLVTYIETSDDSQMSKAASLEKSAEAEMLTAHAAEQQQGLGN